MSRYRALALLLSLVVVACASPASDATESPGQARASGLPAGPATSEQVLHGRALVISHACGDCHGGGSNPAAPGWLAGARDDFPGDAWNGDTAWAKNLTPDDETGSGRYSARQIFNALRYGLRPSATPDVEITSSVPGQGNHPSSPDYLSPIMPWMAWRYMADAELWAIAAYLKHGVNPVVHRVRPSQGPPDKWASEFAPERIGTHILPEFPTEQEQLLVPERREQVLRGRRLVASLDCSGCHGGAHSPGQRAGWLSGSRPEMAAFGVFQIGPWATYPRNLTPHNTTGMGRFSERQIFNALRYGLRPGETPDVEITSSVPGQGNHPASPKYLAIPMPWPAWRHLPDQDLWDIAAYLKLGVKPVANRVTDSDGPPDFWASFYTPEAIGPLPAVPFPTANERSLR